MKILNWDLATVTGQCIGDGYSPPRFRRIDLVVVAREMQLISKLKDFDTGHLLLAAMTEFEQVIMEERPDAIVIECPILRGATTISTTRRLQGLAGIAEMLGVKHRIPVYDVEITTVKLELSGCGFSTKDQQLAAARAMGVDIDDDNIADSYGIYGCSLKMLMPDAYPAWKALQQNDTWYRNKAAASAGNLSRRREKAAKKAAEIDKPKTVKRAPAKTQRSLL